MVNERARVKEIGGETNVSERGRSRTLSDATAAMTSEEMLREVEEGRLWDLTVAVGHRSVRSEDPHPPHAPPGAVTPPFSPPPWPPGPGCAEEAWVTTPTRVSKMQSMREEAPEGAGQI